MLMSFNIKSVAVNPIEKGQKYQKQNRKFMVENMKNYKTINKF
jgi:hypothetical protein